MPEEALTRLICLFVCPFVRGYTFFSGGVCGVSNPPPKGGSARSGGGEAEDREPKATSAKKEKEQT